MRLGLTCQDKTFELSSSYHNGLLLPFVTVRGQLQRALSRQAKSGIFYKIPGLDPSSVAVFRSSVTVSQLLHKDPSEWYLS